MANSDVLIRMKADTQGYDANIAKARRQLQGFVKDNLSAGGAMKQLSSNLVATAARFASVTAAIGALGAAFRSNIETARGFEKSMSQLSSLTGMVGSDLEKLKGYAIELGASTTLSASQVADAFKMIGSQQPQLLESGEALKAVTKNAITLAEAAGIELADAAKTLSVSINQMGGDSGNAERYINVLAAASQKGAGDIAWLGEAITKSGTTAKAVGTDYEELVANLEQLAKAGYDASTAGTALRSIIMNLEKQANNDYKPSVVGLTQAFKNLGDAHLTLTEYQEIAGKMFAAQAKALADAAGEAENMKIQITGTNTAEEQAKTNTDNLDGSLKSLASAWEGLNLHLNASNGYLRDVVDWLKDVVTWADKAIVGLGEVTGNRDKLNNEGDGGQTNVDRQINTLANVSIKNRQATYRQQVEYYWRYINAWNKKLKEAENRKDVFAWETIKKNNDIATARANIEGAKSMLNEYQSRAAKLLTSPSSNSGKNGNAGTVTVDVNVDTENATKSIKELQDEIKKLKALRDDAADAGDTEMRDSYNNQIKAIQAQIKAMRGGGTTGNHHIKTEQTELQKNQHTINKLTEEYVRLGDYATASARERQAEIQKEISALNQRNNVLKLREEQAQGKLQGGWIMKTNLGGDTFANAIPDISKGLQLDNLPLAPLQQLNTELQHLRELLETAPNTEAYQTVLQAIADKEKEIANFKGMATLNKDAEKSAKSFQTAAGAVTSLGSALGSLDDPGAKIAATVAQAIANIALAFSNADLKDGESGNLWYWIAATAAGVATMVSTISSIHSSTGYAQGGLIKGNSYSGDNIGGVVDGSQFVGLNAGELVLNASQQSMLASNLQGSGGGKMEIVGVLTGENVVLMADRFGRRTGRGELLFGKNL